MAPGAVASPSVTSTTPPTTPPPAPPPSASASPSTPSQPPVPPPNAVPMVSPAGQIGYVPQEKVDAAQAARYERAVMMQDAKGNRGYVAESKVDGATAAGFKRYIPPASPGPVQRFQNSADQLVNAPIPGGFDTGVAGQAERFGQGVLQGGESVLVHPINTAHSAVELPLDMLHATGWSMTGKLPDAEMQAARDRLSAQWQQAKENPAQTAGQLVGGGLITHGASDLTDAGIRAGMKTAAGTGEALTGASDLGTGTVGAIRKAGEQAIDTQAAAGQANATALKGYAAKVEKATQTVEEQKAAAASKAAAMTAEQQLDHATQVEHLQAQQAADEQAASITSDEARQKAQQLYAQNVQDVTDLDSKRGDLARQEKQARLQLMRTIQQQEEKAHTAASAQFNDVRKAIGAAEAPVSTLQDAVKAAVVKNIQGSQEKIPIFQDMLNRARNSGEQAALTQSVMKSQGLSGEYDALPPERKATVDKIVADINARSGAPPEPPATMSWDNWRGYSTELGNMLQNPNLEGDVRGALRDVKNHVDAMAQKMANDAGVGDQFQDAKQNWNIYKQVFHEPEGPSGSGSRVAKGFNAQDAFNATQPFLDSHEEVASRARNMLVGDPNSGPGGYFNPGAGKVVDRLRDIVSQQEELPKGKIVEPPALKPDAEPLDIRQIRMDAYQRAADNLKYLNKWQIRGLLGLGGGIISHVFGAGKEGSLLGAAAGTFGPMILGKLIDTDTFRDWISNPRPRDFELLNKLKGSDKIRVKDDVTGQIVSLAEAGQRVKVSPQVQAFVGPENVMRIARVISKTKGTVAGMTGAEKVRAGVKAGVTAAGGVGATETSQQAQQAQQQPAGAAP